MKTSILILVGLVATAGSANADTVPDILGTWQGTHENTDPANSAFGQVNPMTFVVQSEVGSIISGDFSWLPGNSAECPISPCTTTWSGTITSGGQLSFVGQLGDNYSGLLTATIVENEIVGSFSGPNGGNQAGYGTWEVTKVPEISSASATSALTLLVGSILLLTGRRSRTAARQENLR